MSARTVAGLVGAALLAAGLWSCGGSKDTTGSEASAADSVVQDNSGRRVLYWYDPMTPGQRFNKPGKSPFMDMQLVPKYADEGDDSAVQVPAGVQQSLGIRVAKVTHAAFGEGVVAVGRLEGNERKLYALPSRVSGYVERLLVRAVGDPVSARTKVAEIYSPELLSAQQELLSLRGAQGLSGGDVLVAASRERLRLLGMAEAEIAGIERSGRAVPRFGVYSPAGGYVIDLSAREGGEIAAGATLMTIADLSDLWLIAEVAERDALGIRPGDAVEAHLQGSEGDQFMGTVEFIYPTLNEAARTIRVRAVVPNKGGNLRPGMFARVTIAANKRETLSVPSEAIIYTGARSVVIVRENDSFKPVEVKTGAEAGARTEILSGLSEGTEVVSSGQFLIDSEASLSGVLARLSQPTSAAEDPHAGHRMEAAPSETPPPEQVHDHSTMDHSREPRR